ncbi:MAG: ABC transporter substrate-binding protein, partial [Pseudomonadota bacterium]
PLCAEAARVIAAIVAPVPVVSLDTRNPLLDRHRTLDGLSLFEVGPAPEAEATVIVQHVLPTFGDRPFAVIDDGGVYARGLAEAIRLQAMDAGLEPTEVANFRPLQRTQKPLLRRLARSGIEALVVAADAEDVSTIANDLAELGLDWPVVTGEPARLLPFVEGASSVPDGLLAIMPVDVPDAIANALKPRLVFQDDDVSDTLVMGHALMSIALNYDPTKPLSETGSPSLLGLLTFAEDARATPLPMAVHRWQNGAFVRARP